MIVETEGYINTLNESTHEGAMRTLDCVRLQC
jgi:hypothetical protein